MEIGNYSVEVSTIENGKIVKRVLTLFRDEYVFAGKRTSVNWDTVVCEQGTVKVKGFLRTIDKPSVIFKDGMHSSRQFILEPDQLNELLQNIHEFIQIVKNERISRESIVEEGHLKKEHTNSFVEEERQKKEQNHKLSVEEQKEGDEIAHQERESYQKRAIEKEERIQREVLAYAEKEDNEIPITPISRRAASVFIDNPYRILGLSCLATNEEANSSLDKLKKLSRLNALSSYHSAYDIRGIERPVREISIAQNAIVQLKDKKYKFFWFAESDPCIAWRSGKYRIELSRDGEEFGTYDLFLANYLYALLCDPDFNIGETWKRILNYYCYLCEQKSCEQILGRFTEKELQCADEIEVLNSFRSEIFKPIISLCTRDDLDAVIRLHKYIKECSNYRLGGLARNVVSKLVSWFTEKEADILNYLKEVDSEDTITEEKGNEIVERGLMYCGIVDPVFEMVLRDFRGDTVRYDMIKESYRHTTYQLMYELNKCSDKSHAILFANKCFSYCSADDKKRIQNTFGEINIKAINWSIPHTAWDIKGDNYYYGRGCSVDYSQALYWYHKAADAGNLYSPNSIGICYQKGQGVPQSDEQAASWFEKAYKVGNPQGAYNLAESYYAGAGVEKNIDKALKYWKEAVKLGHPSAEQRRQAVFVNIQAERKSHRAHNHICHDLGFQMTTGPSMVVEVTLNKPANAYLVNAQGYQNYVEGNDFRFFGGYAASTPYRIKIPSSNHWYVIIDNGNGLIEGITSSVKVKRA